jgi:hypothetical protein
MKDLENFRHKFKNLKIDHNHHSNKFKSLPALKLKSRHASLESSMKAFELY